MNPALSRVGGILAAAAKAPALILVCARLASAQSSDSLSRRLIGVYDATTGEAIEGVRVRDEISGTYALTTLTGTVRLNFLTFRGGAAIVDLTKLGYEEKILIVDRNDTTSITELLEHATMLAPVVTTERYRLDRDAGQWAGFEQRCQSTAISCIKNDELEQHPSASIADFLVHAKEMTIGPCGGGGSRKGQCGKVTMRSSVIPPSYCEPTIFVDGYIWNSKMGEPIDLAVGQPPSAPFTPTNVKGIEVYPTDKPRPPRFGGDPHCGAIVVWTK